MTGEMSSVNKSYTIAFLPADAFGCIYPCMGLAQVLTQMGHKCVFVVNQCWPQVLSKHGFESRVYVDEEKNQDKSAWNEFMVKFSESLKLSAFDKIRAFDFWTEAIEEIKRTHHKVLDVWKDLKPDLIIMDNFESTPAVTCSGIPWVLLCSGNFLHYTADPRLPPKGSGLPADDQKQWKEFIEEFEAVNGKKWDDFNEWHRSVGAPPLQHRAQFIDPSPYLNLYNCPKELDYNDIAPKDPNKFFAVDNFCREDTDDRKGFEIPQQLRNVAGKLIYLSMGTLACSELNLMKRLVSILSKSKHRFIVSKGPLGDQLSLPDNMWGLNSLPQTRVLPKVDAVITHGGNNTVTECLSLGTPMIVLPVFSDQFDNAQRIQEKGLGLRLDPYMCTENELLSTVDKLVNDSQLRDKYKKISERIRTDRTKEKAAQLVVELINKVKQPQ